MVSRRLGGPKWIEKIMIPIADSHWVPMGTYFGGPRTQGLVETQRGLSKPWGAQLRVQPCHSDSVTSGRKLAFDGSARRESYHALYPPPTATVMLPYKPSPKSVGFHTCHLFQVMDLQVSCSKMSRSISGPPLGVFFPPCTSSYLGFLIITSMAEAQEGCVETSGPRL